MPQRRSVVAKTGGSGSTTGTSVSENTEDEVSQPLADNGGKNNLLPTIIVLSIVIGCVAIVSVSKKTA